MKKSEEPARMQFTLVLKQAFAEAGGRKPSKYVSKGPARHLAQLVADTQFVERRVLYAQSSTAHFKPVLQKLPPWPAKAKEEKQLGWLPAGDKGQSEAPASGSKRNGNRGIDTSVMSNAAVMVQGEGTMTIHEGYF